MPTFGPYQFTSATDVGDNTHPWENPDNAVDSENISTASSFTDSSAEDEFTDLDTATLRLSGFTAAPSYVTIDGVALSIRIANAQTGAVWAVKCRRSSDGATSAAKTYTNNTSGGHTVTLGSPTDDWSSGGSGAAPVGFDQIDIVCTDTADNYNTQDAKLYDAEISIAYTLPDKMYYGSDHLPDTAADKIKYGNNQSIKRIIFDGSIIWQDLNP